MNCLGREEDLKKQSEVTPQPSTLVGVLEPTGVVRTGINFYGTSDLQNELSEEDSEENDDTALPSLAMGGLHLDPRALPKLLGISFVVGGTPVISFCATWARYTKIETKDENWKRVPQKKIVRDIDVSKPHAPWFHDRARILMRTVPVDHGNYHVSIYLINETPIPDPGKTKDYKNASPEHMIYQPEIRVACDSGCRIIPLSQEMIENGDEEEQSLSLVYGDRMPKARGHLCSAIWKEIDPQQVWGGANNPDEIHRTFKWIDAESLESVEERKTFGLCDVRTEYLPIYSIQQSITQPGVFEEPIPGQKTALLADTFESKVLESLLDPFALE